MSERERVCQNAPIHWFTPAVPGTDGPSQAELHPVP